MSNLTVQNSAASSNVVASAKPTPSSAGKNATVNGSNTIVPAISVEASGNGTKGALPLAKLSSDTTTRSDSSSQAVTSLSNIMTYRDSESGQLVVRLVDANNNSVISQFPSKTMLGNYPKITTSSDIPKIDTKA